EGLIPKGSQVLDAGCGTSRLAHILWDTFDVATIICIDSCEKAVQQCRAMFQNSANKGNIQYMNMDIMEANIHFKKGYFNIIIDKGLLDSMLHEEGDTFTMATKCLEQYDMLLCSQGKLILITTIHPEILKPFMDTLKNFECCIHQQLRT